ncbi:MAG: hypothetical protein K0V04_03335, partial [Deltaproteobacteria bacterium]|nr:hypothetical protein [Deltaproteobacteria bacterium]
GKEPMVTHSVEHYSNGTAPQVESAMWDAKNLVDSSLNKTKSLDSVGVHNWMVNDAGWVRPDGSAVLTFTPFGTSNAC